MLKKKIKGIYLALAGENVSDDYIWNLTLSSKEEVDKVIKQLLKEKFIKEV